MKVDPLLKFKFILLLKENIGSEILSGSFLEPLYFFLGGALSDEEIVDAEVVGISSESASLAAAAASPDG